MELETAIDNLFAKTAGNLAYQAAQKDAHAELVVEGLKHFIRTKRFPVFTSEHSFESVFLEAAEKELPRGMFTDNFYNVSLTMTAAGAGVCAGMEYLPGMLVGLGFAYLVGKTQLHAQEQHNAPKTALKHVIDNPDSFESYLRSAEPLIIKELRNYGNLTDLCP